MVIAVVHSLRGVVGGQVVRRWVLSGAGAAPLAQGLLGAVGAVDVVANDPGLARLGHGHVEDPLGVVLGGREGLGPAGGGPDLLCAGLCRVVIGDGGDIRDPGLEAATLCATVAAANAGGRRGRLPVLVEPEEEKGRWSVIC